MGPTWQLTGRAEELRFIDATFRRATGARGVVLAGAAGVGKTRLAREVLARAAHRGAATRWVVATASARALPLGAFANLLDTVRGDPAELARRAGDALLAGAGRGGVVIGVDDAHLLDDLSATVVHHLALRSAATVVLTLRAGEHAPDAVTALWKDGQLERLEVQPLSELETAELLEAALGAPLASSAADRMWRLTQGNPLYLRQLIDGEIEAGRLHDAGGIWRWSGAPTLSPALAELVASRMGTLPDAVRDVVDLLALGEPLGVSLLAELTDPVAVEQAEERGLLHVEKDGRRLQAGLAHPLYGEARRADMGQLRARRLRGHIATALAGTGGRRVDDTLRRAVLTLDSDLPSDPTLLTDAAGMAATMLDFPLAERLSRSAVAAGGGFEAQLALIYMLSWQGRGDESAAEVPALEALIHTDIERVRATIPAVGNLFWVAGETDRAQSMVRTLETSLSDPSALRDITALRSPMALHRNKLAEARSCATEVLTARQPSDQAVILASWGLLGSLALGGRADEIPAARMRAERTAQRFETANLRTPITDFAITGLWLAGRLTEARRLAETSHQLAGLRRARLEFTANLFLSQVELASGAVRTAIRLLTEARAGFADGDPGGWTYRTLIELAQALSMVGEVEAARQVLADAEAARHPSQELLGPRLGLARAWLAAAEGITREAVAHARSAAAQAAESGQFAHEVLALQTAVCFGDRTVADRLGELAGMVDGPRAPAAAAHAAALAADDADGLRTASARLEEMGDLVAAADAAAHAATAYARQGRSGTAQAAAARAQRLAARCDGTRTPALRDVVRPLPLTSREREIVTLAAQGLTNQQIADRLVVSVRTVEGHLYRAGVKLGTTRRTEFAALLQFE